MIFNNRLLLEREKQQSFHLMASLLSRGGFRQKLEKVVKKYFTVFSNEPSFKFSTLNQVIDEENC